MRKFIALLVITSILMVAILPAALAQQTAAPGSVITVEFSFSGPDVYFVDFHYALSSGLSVEGGSALAGGSMGKAGSTRAIFLRPGLAKFNGDTLQLKIKVKEDATGEQTVDLTKIEGYVLGTGMQAMSGAAKKTITISAGEKSFDVTGDGKVNMRDVMAVLEGFLKNVSGADKPEYDFNNDSKINMRDVMAVLEAFLKTN
jgi:hypothetical protein